MTLLKRSFLSILLSKKNYLYSNRRFAKGIHMQVFSLYTSLKNLKGIYMHGLKDQAILYKN